MVDTSMFTGMAMGWLQTGIFWIALAVGAALAGFGFMYVRKQFKFKIPVIEIIRIGNGKVAFNKTKGGWFKSISFLGLFDYAGETYFKIKDGRKVLEMSSEDYHLINNRSGLVVIRKDDDHKVLAPLSRIDTDPEAIKERLNDRNDLTDIERKQIVQKIAFGNYDLLMNVAPAEFRDAAVDNIRQAEKESMTSFDKILPYLAVGVVVVGAVVMVVVVSQMIKSGQTHFLDIIEKANGLEPACRNLINTMGGLSP